MLKQVSHFLIYTLHGFQIEESVEIAVKRF